MAKGSGLVLYFIAACSALTCTLIAADDIDPPTVTTSTATFRGKREELRHPQLGADFSASVAAYTRIPYAEPPVGDRRYARPVPHTIVGDFDATGDHIACLQYKMDVMYDADDTTQFSEDCLYLDVFVPEPQPQSAAVMVWIHGGGFHFGSKSIAKASPIALPAVEGAIIVLINYRIGLLGFSSTGDDAIPANLGLWDQRQSLVWVQENIAAFGGDPSRVTILGESAGSASVHAQLLAPASAGLFSRAVMQSGTLTPRWSLRTTDVNKAFSFGFGKAIGCDVSTSEELVSCLRGKSEDEIMAVLNTGTTNMYYAVAPVADGVFLPEDPNKAEADGAVNADDVLIGCTADEGNLFVRFLDIESNVKPEVNRTSFGGAISMFSQLPSDPLIYDVIEYVYSTPEELVAADPDRDLVDVVAQFSGDRAILCPTFVTSQQLARSGRSVYAYVMTHIPAYSLWGKNFTWLGASHGEDLPYVFGTPFTFDYENADNDVDWNIRGRLADDEVEVARGMMKYWANFAKTGNPNLGTSKEELHGGGSSFPAWPRYAMDDPAYKELSKTMENRSRQTPNPLQCFFIDSLLPKLEESSVEMTRLKASLDDDKKDEETESTNEEDQTQRDEL